MLTRVDSLIPVPFGSFQPQLFIAGLSSATSRLESFGACGLSVAPCVSSFKPELLGTWDIA